MPMNPFQISVPDSVLDDLRDRLARTRFPDQLDDAEWRYGTELNYLRELCAYWRDEFDWRKQEALLNRFDQYTTEINGAKVHFIHQRSAEQEAVPLVITHGWPGSIFEFWKIIGPLTDPRSHGRQPADAFHVVCPSMPGYGFSDAPSKPGFDALEIAEVNAELMRKLGYERYGAQGGDWGAFVSCWLGRRHPQSVIGMHLNFVLAAPAAGDETGSNLTPDEQSRVDALARFQEEETGYQRIQGTKPQTLGYGLNDSPAGLAAWVIEKFRTWSDCDGDIESRFTRDELLTNVMIYWITESITSSTRLYYESNHSGRSPFDDGRIEVPTGCAIFPAEIVRPPRSWAERHYDIRQWTEMPSGGHFAAMEEPDLLVDDIAAFFRELR